MLEHELLPVLRGVADFVLDSRPVLRVDEREERDVVDLA